MKQLAPISLVVLLGIAVFLFILPIKSFADCAKSGTTVVYINGIFTAKQSDADSDRKLLANAFEERVGKSDVNFVTGYNSSHGAGVLDVVDAIAAMCSGSAEDYDFTNILLQLHDDLKTQKVLLVGYSEGSFFANAIYKYLIDHGADPKSVAVYNIATPANTVAGGGKYVTSETDKTIENVVKGVTGRVNVCNPLPANITYKLSDDEQNDPFAGHYFSKDYLALAPDRIISDIDEALDKLTVQGGDKNECFIAPQTGVAYKLEGEGYFAVDTVGNNPQAFATSPYTPTQMTDIAGGFFGAIYNFGQQIAAGVAGIFNQDNFFGASLASSPVQNAIVTTVEDSFYHQPPAVDFQVASSLPEEYTGTGGENVNPTTEQERQDLIDNIQEKIDIIARQVQALINQQNPVSNIVLAEKEKIPEDAENKDNDKQDVVVADVANVNKGGSVNYPKILISEVQAAGATDDKQEFIELYNPSNQEVDLTDWYLQRKTSGGASWSTYVSGNLFSGKTIAANGYFLIARTGYYVGLADVYTENPITSDNSFVLKNPNGDISDKLGYGNASDPENVATSNPAQGQSIGRKVVSDSEQDSDNNYLDFEVDFSTPKAKNIKYVTPFSPPTDPVLKNILISEVQTAGVTAKDEFIELYNPNSVNVDLTGFELKKKTSGGAESVLVSSASFVGTISANGYFLVAPQNNDDGSKNYTGVAIPNLYYSGKDYSVASNNTILLYNKTGVLSDKVGFGSAVDFEKRAAENPSAGQSIGRKSGEQDADDNSADFELDALTPDAQNTEYSLKDTTAPIISLIGSSELTITVGDEYNDAGATALDDIDGDVTAKIVTVNPVNNNLIGDYTITYNVSDAAGNPATQVLRLVHVTVIPPIQKILIVEAQIEGNTTHQDFINLYNPNNFDVPLKNYRLVKRAETSNKDTTIKSWSGDANAKILANSFYLWASSTEDGYAELVGANAFTKQNISVNNGIALRYGAENTGEIVDALGWGTFDNVLFEKFSFAISPEKNKELIRMKAAGNYKDTDDNSQDFIVIDSLKPSSDATISSSIYTMDQRDLTIGLIPVNTSKASLLAGLIKNHPNQIWDDSNIKDPVATGDTLVVTAQDQKTKLTYIINVDTVTWTQGWVDSFIPATKFHLHDGDFLPDQEQWCAVYYGVFRDTYPRQNNGNELGGMPCGDAYGGIGTYKYADMVDYSIPGEYDIYLSFCEGHNCGTWHDARVGDYYRLYFDGSAWSPLAGTDTTIKFNDPAYTVNESIITVPFGTSKNSLLGAIIPATGATINSDNVSDPVATSNTFVVSSQGGVVKATYTITVSPDPLIAAKVTAHNALTTALAGYTETNYSPENWVVLTGFKTNGDTAVDSAVDLAGVTLAQNTATAGMAGVPQTE